MAKEKKKMSVEEAVGDTSGINQGSQSSPKRRKIVIFSSLGAMVLLVLLIIFFLASPIKVEFYYQDGANKAERHVLDRKTMTLESAPSDPTRTYFTFGGWYFNADTTNGDGLFNNSEDTSLLEYKFQTKRTIVLYARWTATEYKITYDCKGNANLNDQRTNELEASNPNPSSYYVKHTLTNYERIKYVEKLRQENPSKYVNSNDAEKNLADQVELYSNETQKSELSLQNLSLSGWEFLGWYDNNGNKVTSLSTLDPSDIKLTARWNKL